MMDVSQFLAECLLLDLETRGDKIDRIGAVRGDAVFERKGRFDLRRALRELDVFSADVPYLLGHNLLDHDVPTLHRVGGQLQLLKKPIVDTLFLSPLAFPENPYHRLVKDYKLVKEALNDPVADARLAASLFRDEWERFTFLQNQEHREVLSLYRTCFEGNGFGGEISQRGFVLLFDALGISAVLEKDVPDLLIRIVGDRVCRAALAGVLGECFRHVQERTALAYAVAWLQVAGSNSVLPPWIRHRFPMVTEILRKLRDIPCGSSSCAYCRTTHDPKTQLKRTFGFSHFRPSPAPDENTSLQEEIVRHGMGDNPLLAILPTGGGKSLCYQLPALVRHYRRGLLTIVISPLQALMKDQVDNLVAKTGSPSAAALYGMLTPPERGEVLERVRLGDVAILYVAPEQLRNKSFRRTIAQREIGCWVFDEAHCLSKWGHDFRPDYLYAGRFIRELAREQKVPVPPVACFTATAKKDVKEEIVEYFLREMGERLEVFEGGVERENLHFEVQLVNHMEKYARIHAILNERLAKPEGSALVYTATRRNAEDVAKYLLMQGWKAAAYHAGLNVPEKRMVLEAFIGNEVRVICATNAFGMGIDKEDVRLVLHADIPGSLENYLQEAGRAGRDLRDAECVLLYDEQDVETQFKLEAVSELNRRDISEILRGLRRARRNANGEVVITTGELLRDDDVEVGFDSDDHQANTKVKAAVAWLERAGFLERNHNETRVFQGKPVVTHMEEARKRVEKLNLSQAQQKRWLAILEALINAEADEGMSADELAGLPQFMRKKEDVFHGSRSRESDTDRVLRTLHDMAEAGLIKKGLLLTAYVRHKGPNQSQRVFRRICLLEDAMLKCMRESAPDAASEGWLDLSIRRLNQKLVNEGHSGSNPEVLLKLLRSLSMDGRGFAGNRGSLELRLAYQDHYRVRLQRDWDSLTKTAKKRQMIAKTALDTILAHISEESSAAAEVLVDFSSDEIAQAMRSNVLLAGQIKDPLAAIDRGLMFLHEQKIITLQQGLAVFRQSMTIHILPESRNRRYAKRDFEPLQAHYRERVLQIHVMNEYARLGLNKIRQALELILAYFSLDKVTFIERYFPGQREMLERATSQDSYRHIVEELRNPVQEQVVTAPEESNMLILAGPGAGKTRVVVHRCAYLLRVLRVAPRSILVLCFNRNAAMTLRKRLFELVGADAKGVTVQTYHGLAMRLTGTSFAELAEKGGVKNTPLEFDRLISEAVQLLRGEKEILGLEADELRDRLMAGYRHILVDEYQDIDADQYALISALAGRTEKEPDRKLNILAVGDDDQNIYTFRGANVQFIRRFREDYHAETHHLVENYRSTANIIAASNQLIAHNIDRMKRDSPIRIDTGRREGPAGGEWYRRDAVVQGKVQVLQVDDGHHQAMAFVSELQRLRQLKPDLRWNDCAVLARTRKDLDPIRGLCEHYGIPVRVNLSRDKAPSLSRIREIANFINDIKVDSTAEDSSLGAGGLARASQLRDRLATLFFGEADNPWVSLLRNLLQAWEEETAGGELPVNHVVEYIYETLSELRRDQWIGDGVFLGTVHGTKGMEFSHVFIPDGGWSVPGAKSKEQEEERRVFYVAMTRAKETLCLIRQEKSKNPHLKLLQGDFMLQRPGSFLPDAPRTSMEYSYELLGMQDLFLDYAGRRPRTDFIHKSLAALKPGSRLKARRRGDRVELLDEQERTVAVLSRTASRDWIPRIPRIKAVRVVAMVQRESRDSGEEFQQHCRCARWEIPWVEVLVDAAGSTSSSKASTDPLVCP